MHQALSEAKATRESLKERLEDALKEAGAAQDPLDEPDDAEETVAEKKQSVRDWQH